MRTSPIVLWLLSSLGCVTGQEPWDPGPAPVELDAAVPADGGEGDGSGAADLGPSEAPDVGPADAGQAEDAGRPRPNWCPEVSTDPGLQEVTGTPASPYLVHHPASGEPAATVVFAPGADGSKMIATQFIWPRWLSRGSGVERVRVVVPYTNDGNFLDEGPRLWAIGVEVLHCFGGDPDQVHLGGTSNGGLTAFGAMLEPGHHFASLLGAPGLFSRRPSDQALLSALTGKRVLLAVGAEDTAAWRDGAGALDQRLRALGLDSTLTELPGEGHILSPTFDATVFYDFWLGR